MNYIYGIILGLLRGLGGTLPISESGHELILQKLVQFPAELLENAGLEMLLQLAVLAAVVIAFYQTVWKLLAGFCTMIGGIFTGKFKWRKAGPYQMMAVYLLVGTVPLLIMGYVQQFFTLSGNLILAGVLMLANAGLIFIGTHSLCHNWTMLDMKTGHALKLGLFQAAAEFLPGLSRTGTTISMARNMGFKKETALEFSFMLTIPALIGGILANLGGIGTLQLGVAGVAVAAALAAALLSVLLVKWLIKTDRFGIFMFYSAAAGIAAIILNFI
ncbi:MAG: undecaprenyl-diphosphate phosphatase [Clostridia bacterium]|nr:undecaprenyl-diphosphate phosphatase [Clostridia bacterium]